MGAPDWKSSSSIHGGNIADIPKPHVRKFPHGRLRRELRVVITSFVGVCGGARHYSPCISEEHNPIWDSNRDAWVEAWNDLEGHGTTVTGPRLLSEAEAKRWVQDMLKAFDRKKYRATFQLQGSSPRWFYGREGD